MLTSKNSTINPKVCLVYDRVTSKYGGAEFVLKQLLSLFPRAPLFTAIYNQNSATWVKKERVKFSFINNLPLIQHWYQLCAPLLPIAFETLDLSAFDIVISLSSAEAKGVITKPWQLHINYLFSPPKYLQAGNKAYLRSYWLLKMPLMLALAEIPLKYLRWWDQVAATRPDYIIPLSQTIRQQLSGNYNKNLLPHLYPPVAFLTKKSLKKASLLCKQPYFLSLSRLVWYKRIDLVIAAALKTNIILLIAGDGVMKKQLLQQAKNKAYLRQSHETVSQSMKIAQEKNIKIIFLGEITEQEKTSLLTHAQATIQVGKEDFGIVAIESLAHETPAIVFARSGAAEIVRNKRDGLVLRKQSVPVLCEAIIDIQRRQFSPKSLRERAKLLAPQQYKKSLKTIVYDVWKTHFSGVRNYVI